MPPTEPKNGLRLLAGLPQDNGLTPESSTILDDAAAPVYAVVRLGAVDNVQHLQHGTATVVMRIDEIEVMRDARGEDAKKLLDTRRAERRSEERAANGEQELAFEEPVEPEPFVPTLAKPEEKPARKAAAKPARQPAMKAAARGKAGAGA